MIINKWWKDLLNKSKEMAMKGAATVKSSALDAKDKLSQSHAEKKAAAKHNKRSRNHNFLQIDRRRRAKKAQTASLISSKW